MKYREVEQSQSHKSIQPANRSLGLPPAPFPNRTSTLIPTSITNPPPTSTRTSPTINKAINAPSLPPHPRHYINPLSLRISIINPKEVVLMQPVECQRVKPNHQPLLHSPPRAFAEILIIRAQQSIQPTQQSIMSEATQQPISSDEPDAAE